jgi:hypothetical protein
VLDAGALLLCPHTTHSGGVLLFSKYQLRRKIILPERLITNYKKAVQYHTGLSMQSDIITDKRRLLERFFSSFRSKAN